MSDRVSNDRVPSAPTRWDPLPPQPFDIAWPGSSWEAGQLDPQVDAARLSELLDTAFDADSGSPMHLSLATVVIQGGRIVAERYGPTASVDETLISWSMAKSVTHALVGLLVGDDLLELAMPAPIADWANDDRRTITIEHLLSMTSGLRFEENYVDDSVSDVIEMLFGGGQTDVAAYARNLPLDHEPGTVFNYSSGTTNILAALCGDIISPGTSGGERADAVRTFLHERLFEPIGMTTAEPRFDDAGTFVGSSFLYCTARDFARFGYLYLRDGMWGDERILPEGWVEKARRPLVVDIAGTNFWYGHHWWLWSDQTGAFGCHGYEGQYIVVCPSRDLVVVRLGKTPDDVAVQRREWLTDLITTFPECFGEPAEESA